MVVNWDGTIESTWDRSRAVVLGVDDQGQIVLTNYANANERLQLRMDAGGIPITGLRAPTSPAIPLHLAGRLAGKALVLADHKRFNLGSELEYVRLGPQENALSVHVEPDGVMRLANRPHQAFQSHRFATTTNTQLFIYHHCNDDQKFVVNEDATLSPVGNRDVVWGVRDNALILVGKDDPRAEHLTFREEFVNAAGVSGAETYAQGEASCREDGVVLELASHPGMALSAIRSDDDSVQHLVLVPTGRGQRFIVAADHLRLANGVGTVALGTPMP